MRGCWRRNRTATYWPPLLWPSAFFSPFSWATQPRAWGPAALGAGFLYRILMRLQLLNREPEGPLCWVLAFSTASCLQLTDFLSSPGLYNNLTSTLIPASVTILHTFNPFHGQGYYILIFLDRMHLLFTRVHFLFWQPGRVGGQYTTQGQSLNGIKLVWI